MLVIPSILNSIAFIRSKTFQRVFSFFAFYSCLICNAPESKKIKPAFVDNAVNEVRFCFEKFPNADFGFGKKLIEKPLINNKFEI